VRASVRVDVSVRLCVYVRGVCVCLEMAIVCRACRCAIVCARCVCGKHPSNTLHAYY